MRFAPQANFLGNPSIAVPVGFDASTGLPASLQLLGKPWQEGTLLRLAGVLESVLQPASCAANKQPQAFINAVTGLSAFPA